MKITIEPTVDHANFVSSAAQHTVILAHPYDDLGLEEVISLVSAALVAYGFSKAGVAEYFEELANR